MPVGACSCGAVYACDITGHNLGAAFIEALVCGCNGDWDLAWGLLPEEDYLEELVENYDYETHRIVPGGAYQGRRISGALYFIKLQPDILEVTRPEVDKKPVRGQAAPEKNGIKDESAGVGGEKRLSKQEIRAMVASYQVEPLLNGAQSDHRLVRELQRLLCSSDELLRFRAADILGKAAAVITSHEPEVIARLLQGLVSSVSDPGAAAWGAVDAAGEIIASTPATFAGYIPALYQLLAHPSLRPRAMRALARIARVRPDLLRRYTLHFLPFLQDADPETRGYAACLLESLQAGAAREALQALLDDNHPVTLYHNGVIEKKTVGQLAAAALAKIEVGTG